MQEFLAIIEMEDLDPALGFLHQLEGNRPSLALDLMEPFRHPLIDRLVLTAVNRRMFQPSDFSESESAEGLHLHPEALKRFLSEYERFILAPVAATEGAPSVRRLIHDEVGGFARRLGQSGPWRPFAFPWEPKREMDVSPSGL